MEKKDQDWTFEEITLTGLAMCAIVAIAIVALFSYLTPFLNSIIWGTES